MKSTCYAAALIVSVAIWLSPHAGIAYAEDTTPEFCASIDSDTGRLTCYDSLFKKAVAAPAGTGRWQVTQETSKMDDSATWNLELDSAEGGAQLNIRCEEGVTTLYFKVGGKFLADIEGYGQITYRIDAEKAQKKSFEVSTDNEGLGLWSGGNSIPFIKKLIPAKKLSVSITPYNESADTSVFEMNGMATAIEPLRKQCKW